MPEEGSQRVGGDAETQFARSMERVVASEGFAELLARVVENVVALQRMASGALDLLVRNLRLAGRQDLTRLGRQVARSEDKLERVLQEVEALQEPQGPAVPQQGSLATRRSAFGGAAVIASLVGPALVALHPPSLAGVDEAVALAAGALALIVATAWLTLRFACRSESGSK